MLWKNPDRMTAEEKMASLRASGWPKPSQPSFVDGVILMALLAMIGYNAVLVFLRMLRMLTTN